MIRNSQLENLYNIDRATAIRTVDIRRENNLYLNVEMFHA